MLLVCVGFAFLLCLEFQKIKQPIFRQQIIQEPILTKESRKILLIGEPCVGKTKLFSILKGTFRQKQQMLQEIPEGKFEEFELISQHNIVDTPSTQFDGGIDLRQNCIQLFQGYFIQNGTQIGNIFIVVNFERNDLMKKKIEAAKKDFPKFQSATGLIVTDFQKSENPEQDKLDLLNLFEEWKYKIPKEKILFIGDDITQADLKNQILNASNIFDWEGTIFALEDEQQKNDEMQKIVIEPLNKRLKQNDGKFQQSEEQQPLLKEKSD